MMRCETIFRMQRELIAECSDRPKQALLNSEASSYISKLNLITSVDIDYVTHFEHLAQF